MATRAYFTEEEASGLAGELARVPASEREAIAGMVQAAAESATGLDKAGSGRGEVDAVRACATSLGELRAAFRRNGVSAALDQLLWCAINGDWARITAVMGECVRALEHAERLALAFPANTGARPAFLGTLRLRERPGWPPATPQVWGPSGPPEPWLEEDP